MPEYLPTVLLFLEAVQLGCVTFLSELSMQMNETLRKTGLEFKVSLKYRASSFLESRKTGINHCMTLKMTKNHPPF